MFAFAIVRASNGSQPYNGQTYATCLIFLSGAKEVAHFFLSRFKSAIIGLHPG